MMSASSLPDDWKERICAFSDTRITKDGTIVIQSTSHRSQEKNREEAVEKLHELILAATEVKKKRKKTRIPQAMREERLKNKSQQSEKKAMRKKPKVE